MSATAAAGADSVLGFRDVVPIVQVRYYARYYWLALFDEAGLSISQAHTQAYIALLEQFKGDTDPRLNDVNIVGGGVVPVPARFGQ